MRTQRVMLKNWSLMSLICITCSHQASFGFHWFIGVPLVTLGVPLVTPEFLSASPIELQLAVMVVGAATLAFRVILNISFREKNLSSKTKSPFALSHHPFWLCWPLHSINPHTTSNKQVSHSPKKMCAAWFAPCGAIFGDLQHETSSKSDSKQGPPPLNTHRLAPFEPLRASN